MWNNITVPVGTADWASSNSAATWSNITGLRMDFTWPSSSSIDLRVDGLFFRGIYKGSLDVYGSSVLHLFSVEFCYAVSVPVAPANRSHVPAHQGVEGQRRVETSDGGSRLRSGDSGGAIGDYCWLLTQLYPTLIIRLKSWRVIPENPPWRTKLCKTPLHKFSLVGSIVQIAIWVWIFGLGTFIMRAVTVCCSCQARWVQLSQKAKHRWDSSSSVG